MGALNMFQVTLKEKQQILDVQGTIINEYNIQVHTKDSIINLKSEQFGIQTTTLNSANELLEKMSDLLTKAERRIKWLRIQRGILGGAVIVEGALLLFTDI
jgi:hypothetical protein